MRKLISQAMCTNFNIHTGRPSKEKTANLKPSLMHGKYYMSRITGFVSQLWGWKSLWSNSSAILEKKSG